MEHTTRVVIFAFAPPELWITSSASSHKGQDRGVNAIKLRLLDKIGLRVIVSGRFNSVTKP